MTLSCSSSSRWSSSWSGCAGPGVSRPNSEPGPGSRRCQPVTAAQNSSSASYRLGGMSRQTWSTYDLRPSGQVVGGGRTPPPSGTKQKTKPPGERMVRRSSYGDSSRSAPSASASRRGRRGIVDVEVEVHARSVLLEPLHAQVVGALGRDQRRELALLTALRSSLEPGHRGPEVRACLVGGAGQVYERDEPERGHVTGAQSLPQLSVWSPADAGGGGPSA